MPQALAAITAEHVETTRQGEALMLEISQVNLELLEAAGAPVMGGGGHRRRGGLCGCEHARRGAWDRSRCLSSAQQKIKGQHLERLAVIYLRQSSPRQVRENFRSTERQYALSEEAVTLGWEPERIMTVDGDLGVSGRDTNRRDSYKELVGRVCLGEVGAVFGLEVSRLARSSAETQRLLEYCALTDTLVIDSDGVYDLRDFNDQLVLSLSVPDFRPSLTSSTRAWGPLFRRCRLVI